MFGVLGEVGGEPAAHRVHPQYSTSSQIQCPTETMSKLNGFIGGGELGQCLLG